ncbi:uncharacterized protein LOC126681655 [Mercurialis annua]|uniref:uncharacterized protein LOC126681655 n=1 Tax=Mercurialis annua TaxID=3986 RepID=UPI00215EC6D7|nr:uncharacterized protein LOC126681655 [Mercurialis annua]
MEELMGSYREEYGLLHDYAAVIKQTNPGTTCFAMSCSTDNLEGKPLFSMFYVCFEACKKGWMAGCRKIIGINGCFLKGICKGQLLCAAGRDGNNQMFPIAWGVVELETKTTWSWFLKSLINDLELGDGEGYTFISVMQKGLESAMEQLLPYAEHRRCDRKLAFWNCAKSTYGGQLKQRLEVLDGLGKDIVQAALSYGIRRWCKVYFDTSIKCDVVDNNLAETFNGCILEAICKSIITMLEEIRVLVMNRIWTKRQSADSWIMGIAPRAMEKLKKNKTMSHDWEMDWNGDFGYEVNRVTDKDDRHTVDLELSTCTCREWDLTGIPCCHAVCAIYSISDNNNKTHRSDKPEEYVHHYYSKETFLKSYAYTMMHVPGKLHWVSWRGWNLHSLRKSLGGLKDVEGKTRMRQKNWQARAAGQEDDMWSLS